MNWQSSGGGAFAVIPLSQQGTDYLAIFIDEMGCGNRTRDEKESER